MLTPGWVLDGSGFVRGSEVFDGKGQEPETLKGRLEGRGAPKGALVIRDRGIATEDNVAWLHKQQYRYLVVSPERTRPFDFDGAEIVTTAGGQPVHVKKVVSDNGQEVRLFCYSEPRAKTRARYRPALYRAL